MPISLQDKIDTASGVLRHEKKQRVEKKITNKDDIIVNQMLVKRIQYLIEKEQVKCKEMKNLLRLYNNIGIKLEKELSRKGIEFFWSGENYFIKSSYFNQYAKDSFIQDMKDKGFYDGEDIVPYVNWKKYAIDQKRHYYFVCFEGIRYYYVP